MITDPVAARRYLLRRVLAGLTMEGDPPVAVSPEVATSLRTLEGPARMEGAAWREDTTPQKALDMFPDACQRCGDWGKNSRAQRCWFVGPIRSSSRASTRRDRTSVEVIGIGNKVVCGRGRRAVGRFLSQARCQG